MAMENPFIETEQLKWVSEEKWTEDKGVSEMHFMREKLKNARLAGNKGLICFFVAGEIKDGKLHSKTSLRLA